MADWKLNKGRGPWPFTPQYNKWAYLNNPRWLNTPRQFIKGGPDDYDGRESEEPHIWQHEQLPPFSSNDFPKHEQCGHWHKPVTPVGSIIPINPCSDIIPNISYNTMWMYGEDLVITSLEVGAYFDIAHSNIIPLTYLDFLSRLTPSGMEGYWIYELNIPPGEFHYFSYAHRIDTTPLEDWLPNYSIPPTLYNVAYGTKKYWHMYSYYDPNWPGYAVVTGICWDCFYTGDQFAAAGFTVKNIGLYQKSGGVYNLIANTLESNLSWSHNLALNSFVTGPPNLDGSIPDAVKIYLGVLFNENIERQYFPYVYLVEPPVFLRWLGTIGGPTGFSVLLDANGPWGPLYLCAHVPSSSLAYLNLSVNPTSITLGGSATLSWSSSGVTNIVIDNGIGPVAASGSVVVSPTVSTLYSATGDGPGGQIHASTSLGVTTPPPAGFAPAWAYWTFDEVTGDYLDVSGNGRTMFRQGAPASVPGIVDQAMSVDTNTKGCSRPDAWPTAGHFMIAFWAKLSSVGGGLDFNSNVGIYMEGGAADIQSGYVTTDDRWIDIPAGISTDALHFFVIYHDGTGLFLEVDNVPAANDPGASGFAGPYATSSIYGIPGGIAAVADECGIWVGADADTAIAARATLWNGGAGINPYA